DERGDAVHRRADIDSGTRIHCEIHVVRIVSQHIARTLVFRIGPQGIALVRPLLASIRARIDIPVSLRLGVLRRQEWGPQLCAFSFALRVDADIAAYGRALRSATVQTAAAAGLIDVSVSFVERLAFSSRPDQTLAPRTLDGHILRHEVAVDC